jgi:hypothetical protein
MGIVLLTERERPEFAAQGTLVAGLIWRELVEYVPNPTVSFYPARIFLCAYTIPLMPFIVDSFLVQLHQGMNLVAGNLAQY